MSLALSMIGGGAMGSALLRGLLRSNLYAPEQVGLSEPDPAKAEALAHELGIRVLPDNQAAAAAGILILAIKPQVFEKVASQLGDTLPPAAVVVSIMAGIPLLALARAFPEQALIRAMPNTPALVGAGITALCGNSLVTPEHHRQATAIFEAVGSALWVPESQMDAVTALSGSGPGYVAVMVEALIDGGVGVGLSRPVATQLALQTVLGTATLLQHDNLHPALLKDRVTSPGGTTIAGIQVLEQGSVRAALIGAVRAAWQRSQELGQL